MQLSRIVVWQQSFFVSIDHLMFVIVILECHLVSVLAPEK
jgi:hypothetical protein